MLRAVAVMIVLVEHLGFAFWANNPGAARVATIPPIDEPLAFEGFLRPFYTLITHDVIVGNIGVALFFLISGFVIPMSLERYATGRFFVARVFRLYPVWLVGLLGAVVVFAYAAIRYDQPFPQSPGDWLINGALIQDWLLAPYIIPLVWTLLVEIKFYIVCGLMAWAFGVNRALPVLGVVAALTAFTLAVDGRFEHLAADHLYLFAAIQIVAFTAKFIAFMFLGLCFYNLFRGNWSPLKFMAVSAALGGMFVASTYGAPDIDLFKDQVLASFGIGFAAFAVIFAVRDWIPYSRVLNLVADVSYPLYTLHWLFGIVLITEFYKLHPVPLLNVAEAIVVIFGLAYLVHRFIEDPLTDLGKRIRFPREALSRLVPNRIGARIPSAEPLPALPSGSAGASAEPPAEDAGPPGRA